MRSLKEKPYSQAEAELAAGMGSFTVQNINKPSSNKKIEKMVDDNVISQKMDDDNMMSPASTLTNAANTMEELSIG